jgi:2-oxoglutarate ferredoxin oxidoreductase subunit gamma
MRKEVKFAGFGGQGVIKSAVLLSLACGLYEGREVAQTQSYGPEARGGACRSEVVISDEEIDYIKPLHADVFVVMSQPAMDQYIKEIDPQETVVIVDSTLVRNMPEKLKKVYLLEATGVAEREFGSPIFANIIMLGAMCSITGLVSLEALEKSLAGNVSPKSMDANISALRKGYQMGLKLVGKG